MAGRTGSNGIGKCDPRRREQQGDVDTDQAEEQPPSGRWGLRWPGPAWLGAQKRMAMHNLQELRDLSGLALERNRMAWSWRLTVSSCGRDQGMRCTTALARRFNAVHDGADLRAS